MRRSLLILLISCLFYILIAGQVFAAGWGVVNESSKFRYLVSDSEIVDLDLQEDQQDSGEKLIDEIYNISDFEDSDVDTSNSEVIDSVNNDILNRDIVLIFSIGGLIGVLAGYIILRWVT